MGTSSLRFFYTDNPAADKQFLESIFPSLLEDVVPVNKYPNLKPVNLPDDVYLDLQSSASGIEQALSKITDDLDMENDTPHLAVGFDAEWNVHLQTGSNAEPTAIIQIAYRKWVHILQVQ